MDIQWALVLFTVVAGAGAWLFASSMLASLLKKGQAPGKVESIAAFALLVVGGCLSVLHLKHVDRILEALNHPTSGIFIEAAMIGVTCLLVAIYFVMLVRGTSEKARTVIGVFAMIVGVVFTYACGSSYLMGARPAWTTVALPLAYFGTAAAAGAGLNLLIKAILKAEKPELGFAGVIAAASAFVGIVASAAFCIHASAWIEAADNGALAVVAVAFVALAVEALIGILAWRKPETALAMGALSVAAGVVAAVALRVAMWLIGTPVLDFFLMPLE